jgi:hypothetical protein
MYRLLVIDRSSAAHLKFVVVKQKIERTPALHLSPQPLCVTCRDLQTLLLRSLLSGQQINSPAGEMIAEQFWVTFSLDCKESSQA